MLISMRINYSFGRTKGFLLLGLYVVYLVINYHLHFWQH